VSKIKELLDKEKPEALQAVNLQILYDIASYLDKILRHLEETTPKGIHVMFKESITEPTKVEVGKRTPFGPLFSFEILNKGPDTVYMKVDKDMVEIPVEIDESIPYNRGRRTIKLIRLRVNAGEEANVKITARH